MDSHKSSTNPVTETSSGSVPKKTTSVTPNVVSVKIEKLLQEARSSQPLIIVPKIEPAQAILTATTPMRSDSKSFVRPQKTSPNIIPGLETLKGPNRGAETRSDDNSSKKTVSAGASDLDKKGACPIHSSVPSPSPTALKHDKDFIPSPTYSSDSAISWAHSSLGYEEKISQKRHSESLQGSSRPDNNIRNVAKRKVQLVQVKPHKCHLNISDDDHPNHHQPSKRPRLSQDRAKNSKQERETLKIEQFQHLKLRISECNKLCDDMELSLNETIDQRKKYLQESIGLHTKVLHLSALNKILNNKLRDVKAQNTQLEKQNKFLRGNNEKLLKQVHEAAQRESAAKQSLKQVDEELNKTKAQLAEAEAENDAKALRRLERQLSEVDQVIETVLVHKSSEHRARVQEKYRDMYNTDLHDSLIHVSPGHRSLLDGLLDGFQSRTRSSSQNLKHQ